MPLAVLMGPPGSGKSTVGRALSKLLGVSFSDTDALIEVRAGMKISAIFIENGEPFFRKIESEVVAQALIFEDGVVALGGGSILDAATRKLIHSSSALKIFLEVGIGQAAPRIGFNKDRPLLLVNPRQTWQKLLQDRLPIYKSLSDTTISTDSKKPSEVAKEISLLIAERATDTGEGKK